MTREELRAEIAMAICMVGCGIAAHWSDYFGEADAALSAIEAAGVRLVPVDPDDKMLAAGMESDSISHPWEALGVYRQMVSSSPYAALKKPGQ